MLNLYLTSSNHKEGKTFISAGIAATMQSLGYSTCVYKPVQTSGIELNGFMQSPDLTFIKTVDPYIETSFSYLFKSSSEPLIASEVENNPIDMDLISAEYKKTSSLYDCTIIDGDSGLMSPLAPNLQNVDMIKRLQIPCLMVVNPKDTSVNDSLLSIYAAQENGVEIRGVVINNVSEDCPKQLLTTISRVIEEYTNVKILGIVPTLKKLSPDNIIAATLNGIDIESIFNVKIEKLEFC